MEATIDQVPELARLWVYQSDRAFSQEEEAEINKFLSEFVGQWAAHGQSLKASFAVEYHQFIIIAVDESYAQASGCSIDASVGVIRQIESQFGVSLLDRTKIAFLVDDQVKLIPMTEIKEAVNTGEITAETKIFNNTVANARDWKDNWLIPAKDSWMSRYFS